LTHCYTVPYQKALKPGEEYKFGRKAPADLILADKTVSRESATIHVDASREDGKPPGLRIHAHKRQIRIIPEESEAEWREDPDRVIGEHVSPDTERNLEAREIIVLSKSAPSVK
jgi:hypothetical protein